MGAAIGMIASAGQMAVDFNAAGEEWKYNTAENMANEEIARNAAGDASVRGNLEAGKLRTLGSQLVAKQKVAYANSGVDASVGTAADVQADTSAMAALDAQTVQNNAAREAWGYKQQGDTYRRKQEIDTSRSRSKQYSSLLSGLSNFGKGAVSGAGTGG